jgi:septum formation protein
MKLILGSSSPSRIEVLNKMGYTPYAVFSPEIDETPLKKETPKNLSKRLAMQKAEAVVKHYQSQKLDNFAVLSADTVVCRGRSILEKASSPADVELYMNQLSNKNHRVYTTICLSNGVNTWYKTSCKNI